MLVPSMLGASSTPPGTALLRDHVPCAPPRPRPGRRAVACSAQAEPRPRLVDRREALLSLSAACACCLQRPPHAAAEEEALYGSGWPRACSAGGAQSPVALPAPPPQPRVGAGRASAAPPSLALRGYSTPRPGRVERSALGNLEVRLEGGGGRASEARGDGGGASEPGAVAELRGVPYRLVQFHFHTPSEHALGGARAPAEAHLVHASPSGALLVLATLLLADPNAPPNPALAAMLRGGQGGGDDEVRSARADALLPRSRAHAEYPGSLTTPPCTEGVSWLVFDQAIAVPPGQVVALQAALARGRASAGGGEAVMGGLALNARALQPLNGRTVQHWN